LTKITTFQILTIIAVIGMILWNITDYFGGMIIHLFQYWYLILPTFILYLATLVGTIIRVSKDGFKSNKLILSLHVFFIVFVFASSLIESDAFKSKRVLTGTLKDDLFHYTLILRKDGTCENNVSGFLGFEKQYNGRYKMKGDTIVFTKKPYDNNFLPDTIYFNKSQKAIFIGKNKNGEFSTKKQWLNHFLVE
jgi:hypothetical protein